MLGYCYLVEEACAAGEPMASRIAWRICSEHRLWSAFGKKRGKNGKVGPPVHDDLVMRNFTAESPNRLWLSDITEHSITAEGSSTPLDHIWLAPGDARAYGLLVDEFMLYTYRPLPAHTKFRVRVAGTQNGEAKVFDWTFLSGRAIPLPWLLAGGLTPDNAAEAVRVTGASVLDVSSGVESSRGVKSVDLIRAFLETVKAL